MGDLILAQSQQILGNAYYILWKSSINKCWGYSRMKSQLQTWGVIHASRSPPTKCKREASWPRRLLTEPLVSQSPVLFQPQAAKASGCLNLTPSHVQMFFQLVVRLAKSIGSLCLSEDEGKSNQLWKIAWEISVPAMLVWEEWRCRWAWAEPGRRTQVGLSWKRGEVAGEERNIKIWWPGSEQSCASIKGEGAREVKLGHLSLGKKEAISEKVLGVGNEMIINAQNIMGQLSRTVLEFQGN